MHPSLAAHTPFGAHLIRHAEAAVRSDMIVGFFEISWRQRNLSATAKKRFAEEGCYSAALRFDPHGGTSHLSSGMLA